MVESKIKLSQKDQLFLLGDYINKGKNSAGVLDYIIELIKQNYKLYPLRGNHEQRFLDACHEFKKLKNTSDQFPFSTQWKSSLDLLDERGQPQQKYIELLEQFPYYYELDKFYVVHAGFNFDSSTPFTDYSSMVLVRNLHSNPTSKVIVHGHQIHQLHEIIHKVKTRSTIIPLDNGCYKKLSLRNVLRNAFLWRKIGNLCCLNLDTFELLVQKNID
ncbi:metallophosphoesterase [Rhodocytophaga rosea]|uniref:metallophosphoesterase n=1 Tax=Rhodocytophaga rosea TaxID=2704465 RepID=UPI001E2A90B2